jgi:hypothetical protein
MPAPAPARQKIVRQYIKSDQEGLEIGAHAATSVVDDDFSNADLRHPPNVSSTRIAHDDSESVI